jgi:hypothetical protein
MSHLKDEHPSEHTGLLKQLEGDDPESQLVKLVSNAAFVEEKKVGDKKKPITNGTKANGMEAAEELEAKQLIAEVEKVEGRNDYPVALHVFRLLDSRITKMPDYGSLMGRIARLMGVVVGKEVKEEEVTIRCYKCQEDIDGSYADIMPHLEANHKDLISVGRKGIMSHLKDEHPSEHTGLLKQLEGDDPESQLVKLVSNAAFVEEKKVGDKKKPITNGTKANGMEAAEELEAKQLIAEVEKVEGRNDYPVALHVFRLLDSRITKMPDYGSLMGRIARLMGVVVGKEVKEEEVTIRCYKCQEDIDGSYADIMPHLEANHKDLISVLSTMFPPAKKRLGQFIEKAAAKIDDLKVPTEKEVQTMIREVALAKRKKLEEEARAVRKKVEEEQAAKREQMKAIALKRRQEWEESKKKMDENRKLQKLVGGAELTEFERKKQERLRVQVELKKVNEGSIKHTRLQKRLEELTKKIQTERDEKNTKLLEKRTTELMENLSPKQLRKLSMHYFEGLAAGDDLVWKDILEAIKMEEEYSFLSDFLVLLYDYARANGKKKFKFGHMMITSNQSELILRKGLKSVRGSVTSSWRIPSSWDDVENPGDDLGEDWNRKDDSKLLFGCARLGRNLVKICKAFPNLKTKGMDEEGKVKKAVQERFAYLLNVYQNRGKYNEEFGSVFYTEDIDEGEQLIEEDDDVAAITAGDKPISPEKDAPELKTGKETTETMEVEEVDLTEKDDEKKDTEKEDEAAEEEDEDETAEEKTEET